MYWNRKFACALTTLATALWLAGCGSPARDGSPAGNGAPPDSVDSHDEGEHDHPTEGPHHGDLVELGNEEYHAEIVHDDAAGSVTVYILDSSAKSAVPIDAPEVTFNVTHDGQPEQFKLTATPDAGDPAGRSSRFSLADKVLAEHLDAEGATAKLVLTIDGKSFTGYVEHEHGHDHANEHQQ